MMLVSEVKELGNVLWLQYTVVAVTSMGMSSNPLQGWSFLEARELSGIEKKS